MRFFERFSTWWCDLEQCVFKQVDPVVRREWAQSRAIGEAGDSLGVAENLHDFGVIVADRHRADLLQGKKEIL